MTPDEQQTLEGLKAELTALKARVAALENQQQFPAVAEQAAPQPPESPTAGRHLRTKGAETVSSRPSTTAQPDRNRLEEYIGGRLLNWVGALIVVFAVAYFLKWSFDNRIIGEMGRCILGLISGIAFMTAGQICQKKGYRIYSHGLIGAGIAIIYLASFAAVNYYHLITPYVAFALMLVTALTAGILSALDNAPVIAVMAVVGGFMVPFLMGSPSAQATALLSYVLILDLGVLFLAYYRQWIILEALALIGTAVISVIAQTLNLPVWPGQAFFTVFLILFIAVSANYDRRSGSSNRSILFLSSLFFSLLSFGNLNDHLGGWRGLFTLAGAVIFLLAYYLPFISRGTTAGFRRSLLLWALAFALLTAPLHLNDVYCTIAWLAVAAVLFCLSRYFANKISWVTALVIIIAVFNVVLGTYVQPYLMPVFNQASLLLALCALDCLLALLALPRLFPDKVFLSLGLAAVTVAILFYLVHFDINNAIYYYQANHSYVFFIPVAWALISSLALFIGVRRKNRTLRLLSLVLYGVAIIRTLFYDLRQLDIVYKILVLLAIGFIALAISFFYQKRMKGDVLR